MSKAKKIWLIVSVSLLLVGIIVFMGAMMAIDWNFSKLSTKKLETNEYVLDKDFENILIIGDTENIEFIVSDEAKVVCAEFENRRHTVDVKDGVLTIKLDDFRKWYEHISFFDFLNEKVTVYLPSKEYGDLTVKLTTGNLTIPCMSFENVDLSVSTGNVECMASAKELLKISATTGNAEVRGVTAESVDIRTTTGNIFVEDVGCKRFISNVTTADIKLENVIASVSLNAELESGNMLFDRCDAGEIYVKTITGNVSGTLLSDKVFVSKSTTGKVEVPSTQNGGRCEIKTTTGNIKISVVK